MRSRLMTMAVLTALGCLATQASAGAAGLMRAVRPSMPEPSRPERTSTGIAEHGRGTKVRGNRAVQRAALKKRNQARHRRACRG